MPGPGTHERDAADGHDDLDRDGYIFACPQCESRFNRLAHLRRHEMTHGGEKPYNCLYCPVASTRKDVIVRHTRNFHPGAPVKKSKSGPPASGHRGKRRRINSEGASEGTQSPVAGLSWTSSTAATIGGNGEPEAGPHTVADIMSDETPEGSTASHPVYLDLGTPLPTHTDLINPLFLDNSPLDFAAPFMGQDFDYTSIVEGIDIDGLLSNPDDFLVGIASNTSRIPETGSDSPSTRVPEPKASPSPGCCRDQGKDHHGAGREMRPSAGDASNDCVEALSELSKYPAEIIASFRFPSKHATRRFVSAFFRHIAPHIPIVHEATFDVPTVPSPLLLATMACGAAYVSEQSTAISLHTAAMQLILEHERPQAGAAYRLDDQTPIWSLQTYLLLSYYGVHCGIEGKATHTFPNAVIMSRMYNRAGGLARLKRKRIVPDITCDRGKAPTHILHNDDALKEIFAGRPPKSPISEFGLVTLVSTVLYRICSFEALTSADLADLHTSLGEHMGRSVQALDDMIRRRIGDAAGVPPEPIMQSARSLLNSAFYHLYASIPLAVMKKLVWSPAGLSSLHKAAALFSGTGSPSLYKALIRAADQLRIDCRLGPKYLRTMAPLHYGPEGAIGPYEGGLLLFWYLEFAHSHLPQAESRDTLSALIDEGLLEVEDLRLQMQGRPQSLPLAVTAELLSDGTVWKWPSAVSQKLNYLINSFNPG